MLHITTEGNLLLTLQRITRMITDGDFSPAPEACGQFIATQVVPQIFVAQGSHRHAWARSDRAVDVGGETLRDTDALYDGLTSAGDRATSRWSDYYQESHEVRGVMRLTPRSVEVGARSRYIVPTHTGFVNARTGTWVPPRPVLYLRPEDVRAILRQWMLWARRTFALRETTP